MKVDTNIFVNTLRRGILDLEFSVDLDINALHTILCKFTDCLNIATTPGGEIVCSDIKYVLMHAIAATALEHHIAELGQEPQWMFVQCSQSKNTRYIKIEVVSFLETSGRVLYKEELEDEVSSDTSELYNTIRKYVVDKYPESENYF